MTISDFGFTDLRIRTVLAVKSASPTSVNPQIGTLAPTISERTRRMAVNRERRELRMTGRPIFKEVLQGIFFVPVRWLSFRFPALHLGKNFLARFLNRPQIAITDTLNTGHPG